MSHVATQQTIAAQQMIEIMEEHFLFKQISVDKKGHTVKKRLLLKTIKSRRSAITVLFCIKIFFIKYITSIVQ